MNNSNFSEISAKRLSAVFIIIGAVLITLVCILFTGSDLNNAIRSCDDAISYMKARCENYDYDSEDNLTKSLIRLYDKTNELSISVDEGGEISEGTLAQYAYHQRLSGVLIFSENMELEKYITDDDTKLDYWKELAKDDKIRDIADYPKKSFMSKISTDFGEYDYAAVARKGKKGIICCYLRKESDPAYTAQISYDNIFTDSTFELNATVIVSDKHKIVNSNNKELQGRDISECGLLKEADYHEARKGLKRVEYNNLNWYGKKSKYKNYDLYVFAPVGTVYRNRSVAVAYTFFVYVLICAVFMLFKQKSAQEHMQEKQRYYGTISAVCCTYELCALVHVEGERAEPLVYSKAFSDSEGRAELNQKVHDCIKGKHVSKEFSKAYREFMDISTAEQRLEENPYLSFEYKDDSGRWYGAHLIPQERDEDNRLLAVVFTLRDITAEKEEDIKIQQSLREAVQSAEYANHAKSDFMRRMSHDIRTPINGILGMIEIANSYPDNVKVLTECRAKVASASGFLLELVNDVLDMGRLESGKIKLMECSFDISAMIDDIVGMVRTQAKNSRVNIIYDGVKTEHKNLIGSTLHIRRVLINILSNAIKYNRRGGSATVVCREIDSDEERSMIEFVCSDTGEGMSEEFQKHMFEPFAQENDTARTHYSGTGLGLSIAKELTERMGGSIKCKSEKFAGTTFTITLPFKIDNQQHLPEQEEHKKAAARLDGVKILVAEDNELNMEIVQFMLMKAGAVTVPTSNGQEAVEVFKNSAPGEFKAVLMDLMMPVMNGLEAAKQIRALNRPDAKSVAIFAMTANAFEDDIELSRSAGMNEHLAKPLDSVKLINTIAQYVQKEKGSGADG